MTDLVSVGFLHPGHWSACFGQSLIDAFAYDMAGPRRLTSHRFGEIGKECHAGRIVDGRTAITRTVLDHSESTWLFMVDSDMGFSGDTIERLISAAHPKHRPVVGALCFAHKQDGVAEFNAPRYRIAPTCYRMAETEDEVGFVPMFDYPRNELVEVDGTGAAAILIHRSVLETVRSVYGDTWWDHITVPKGKTGSTTFSEDLSFCIRAKACGFPIHVHTGIRTTHDKGGVYLDEGTYDLQNIGRAAVLEAAGHAAP